LKTRLESGAKSQRGAVSLRNKNGLSRTAAAARSTAVPKLSWKENVFLWEGVITLDAWSEYRAKSGAFATPRRRKRTGGKAKLTVVTPNDIKAPPSPEQFKAQPELSAFVELEVWECAIYRI
jgi:hypothetical protein